MSQGVPLTDADQERPLAWALVSLFLAPAFIFANMYSTQAILPVLSSAFHISAPTAGLSVSVLVLAVAIGSLIYGPISDRIGRKPDSHTVAGPCPEFCDVGAAARYPGITDAWPDERSDLLRQRGVFR